MKTLTLAALAAVVLSTNAFAQTESTPPRVEANVPSAASTARLDGTRIRFGIGSYMSAGWSKDVLAAGLLGASLQIGVQLDNDWAVYAMAQGATSIFSNVGNASVMVERQLFGHLSIATGLGVAQSANNYWGDFETGAGAGNFVATSLNVPVRLAVNIGFENPSSIHQNRFTIALDGAAGVVVNASDSTGRQLGSPSRLALTAGISFGYSLM